MKFIYKCSLMFVVTILFLAALSVSGSTREKNTNQVNNSQRQLIMQTCSGNTDKLYDRKSVINQLAEILNLSIPNYQKYYVKFSEKNERGNLFFIYDLTNPSNKATHTEGCIDFINNHVYHFAPLNYDYSNSHIVILEDGKLNIFRSINCVNSRDKLVNVTNYLEQKLKFNKDKEEILNRVKNYREYGKYYYSDRPNLKCEGV